MKARAEQAGRPPGSLPAGDQARSRRDPGHRVRRAAPPAGARPPGRQRARPVHFGRPGALWLRAATSPARTPKAWPARTGSCGLSSTDCSSSGTGKSTPCPPAPVARTSGPSDRVPRRADAPRPWPASRPTWPVTKRRPGPSTSGFFSGRSWRPSRAATGQRSRECPTMREGRSRRPGGRRPASA